MDVEKLIFVFFDLEGTGLSIWDDQITQIAAIATLFDQEKGMFEELDADAVSQFNIMMCPDRRIAKAAAKVIGYGTKALQQMFKEGRAVTTRAGLEGFVSWHADLHDLLPDHKVVWVAHNGFSYDFSIIFSEFWRWNMKPGFVIDSCNLVGFFDSLPWCRATFCKEKLLCNESGGPSFKLGDLYCSSMGRPMKNAHDAMVDTGALLNVCNSKLWGEEPKWFWNEGDETRKAFFKSANEFSIDFQHRRTAIDKDTKKKNKRNQKKRKQMTLTFMPPKKKAKTVFQNEEEKTNVVK